MHCPKILRQSPDRIASLAGSLSVFSLIENMWSMIAQRLTQITPPAVTPDELWQRMEAAWSAVPKNTPKVSLNQCRGVRQRIQQQYSQNISQKVFTPSTALQTQLLVYKTHVRKRIFKSTAELMGNHGQEGKHPGVVRGLPPLFPFHTNLTRGLAARRLFKVPPCCEGIIHLKTSMSSPGFEPSPNGTAVSVANHYTGWATGL
ncbi:hypothetical protein TNCV_1541581 [Trichonephila clavipes]|nr:hypothetical protein TNCV_1541581 [Trichonephila clavipes]